MMEDREANSTQPLLLYPQPKRVRRSAGWVDVSGASGAAVYEKVGSELDDSIDGQSYTLRILHGNDGGNEEKRTERIEIRAGGSAGLRYAHTTLNQLKAQFGERLPCVEVEDRPSFAKRGVMLDVSRCRMPTMTFLFEMVRTFANLKINHLQLYTEHTFAYAGHENIWRDSSPITPAEIVELDRYCTEFGIELSANQNTFGHMERWLRDSRYEHLAEMGRGEVWDFAGFSKVGPFSLNPSDPRSIELIRDILEKLLPFFSSPLVNIGCDETFDVGQGKSRELVRENGRAKVYGDYVKGVMGVVSRMGKRPMFWGDMVVRDPNSMRDFPMDAIALVWGYEADSPFGEWCDAIRETGLESVWVCPGTSSWRSITGRTSERRANIRRAAVAGIAHGASGFLITDWGDMGHRQIWPISLTGIADGAGAAWNAKHAAAVGASGERDQSAISSQVFGDRSGETVGWIDELGNVDYELRCKCGMEEAIGQVVPLRNSSVLFNALHPPSAGFVMGGSEEEWREEVGGRLEKLANDGVPKAAGELMSAELAHALDVARLAWRVGFLRWFPKSEACCDTQVLSLQLAGIVEEHQRLWMKRSRGGGLDESVGHYESLYDVVEGER